MKSPITIDFVNSIIIVNAAYARFLSCIPRSATNAKKYNESYKENEQAFFFIKQCYNHWWQH